jgi:predicted transglutaminase-like protease
MLEAGSNYTHEFLKQAEGDLERMKDFFLVPNLDLKPAVYLKVTDNWIELTLRYIVDPKKRRTASTFLYNEIFGRIKDLKDVEIASSTMDVTVHSPDKAA